jgi:hypothetical protein
MYKNFLLFFFFIGTIFLIKFLFVFDENFLNIYIVSILLFICGGGLYPWKASLSSKGNFVIFPFLTLLLFNILNLFLFKIINIKISSINILMGYFGFIPFLLQKISKK